jgi:alkylation response protein AidB-like acyl-CoA dehydrogenase
MSDDASEILAAANYFLRVFDDLDWDRFVACWSSNPTAFFPGDDVRLDGRAAVLARFRIMFDQLRPHTTGPPYLRLQPRDLRVDRYGDAGLVTFTLGDTTGPAPLRSLFFVREADGWKLAHVHATNRAMSITAPTLGAIRALGSTFREHADRIDQERCLPAPVVRNLVDAGVFRLLVPRSLSGSEADPIVACRVFEEAASHDGAVGWCAMIGACNGLFGGLLPGAGAHEVFADRDVVLAGTFRPTGVARAVEGGYRVTGRWPFASGIMHSHWLLAGCRILDGDSQRLSSLGAPLVKLMFFPRTEARVIDTWHTGGLRGTGSHDFEVQDIFVPGSRSLWFTDPPVERGPLYRFPSITLFSPLIASVSLGIARHALEVFKELAGVKKPTLSQDLLRASPVAQSQLGQAEGLLRAGRAFLFESLADAWSVVCGGDALNWEQRSLLWLSATQAVTQALHAVDIVYRAGGASSVYVSTQLERCLRDIRTAAQHLQVMPTNYELAGQFFLGAEMSSTTWGRDTRVDRAVGS